MFFCSIALGIWYGALKVADGTYNGGWAPDAWKLLAWLTIRLGPARLLPRPPTRLLLPLTTRRLASLLSTWLQAERSSTF